jgi:hypothetical protein
MMPHGRPFNQPYAAKRGFCWGSVACTLGRLAISPIQRLQLGAASPIARSSGMSGK